MTSCFALRQHRWKPYLEGVQTHWLRRENQETMTSCFALRQHRWKPYLEGVQTHWLLKESQETMTSCLKWRHLIAQRMMLLLPA